MAPNIFKSAVRNYKLAAKSRTMSPSPMLSAWGISAYYQKFIAGVPGTSSVHFDENLRAVACMSLTNQTSMEDLAGEAGKLHGSTIVGVDKKLQNVEQAADDSIHHSFIMLVQPIRGNMLFPSICWTILTLFDTPETDNIRKIRAKGLLECPS